MLISIKIPLFQSSVLELTPACHTMIAGSWSGGWACSETWQGAHGILVRCLCFICRQETPVRVVVSQSCLPSGGLIQGLLLASKNLQSHFWIGGCILKQRYLNKDGNRAGSQSYGYPAGVLGLHCGLNGEC